MLLAADQSDGADDLPSAAAAGEVSTNDGGARLEADTGTAGAFGVCAAATAEVGVGVGIGVGTGVKGAGAEEGVNAVAVADKILMGVDIDVGARSVDAR